MRQLLQPRLKTNVIGKTGSVQPRGNYVTKGKTAGNNLLDLDGDGNPDTIIYQDENITVTEDIDSTNIDFDNDGVIDLEIPK